MLNNNLPKMDDHIHPSLDDYCSFCSLYKKTVSFSSKFGRISHVILKLPKVEENRSIIFFHFWNWTIYGKQGLCAQITHPCIIPLTSPSVQAISSVNCPLFTALPLKVSLTSYVYAQSCETYNSKTVVKFYEHVSPIFSCQITIYVTLQLQCQTNCITV